MVGNNVPRAAIIAGAATVPTVPPTAVVCIKATRGPMILVREGRRGAGEGTGEPRERRKTV